MRIQRLDLGVDVVVVPQEDVVLLHPDLSFGEAVGVVMAVLPQMHPDAVVSLVSQVTQRPHDRSRSLPRAVVAALVLLVVLGAAAATAAPEPYDRRWREAIAQLGLQCQHAEVGRECRDRDGTRYRVLAYTRDDGALYVLRSGGDRTYLRVFEEGIPQEWLEQNPDAVVLEGSVTLWR